MIIPVGKRAARLDKLAWCWGYFCCCSFISCSVLEQCTHGWCLAVQVVVVKRLMEEAETNV